MTDCQARTCFTRVRRSTRPHRSHSSTAGRKPNVAIRARHSRHSRPGYPTVAHRLSIRFRENILSSRIKRGKLHFHFICIIYENNVQINPYSTLHTLITASQSRLKLGTLTSVIDAHICGKFHLKLLNGCKVTRHVICPEPRPSNRVLDHAFYPPLNTLHTGNRCEFITKFYCRPRLYIIYTRTHLILFNHDERLRVYKQLSFAPRRAHQVVFSRQTFYPALNTLYTRSRCDFVTNFNCRLCLYIIIMCTCLIPINYNERLRAYTRLSFGPRRAHQTVFFRLCILPCTKHAINSLSLRVCNEFQLQTLSLYY